MAALGLFINPSYDGTPHTVEDPELNELAAQELRTWVKEGTFKMWMISSLIMLLHLLIRVLSTARLLSFSLVWNRLW